MRKIKLAVLALLASAGTAQAQMTINQLTPGKTIVLKSVSTLANHFFLNPGSASNFAYDATTNNLIVEEATYEAGEEGRTYFRLKNAAGQYIANATSGDLTLTENAEEAAILFAVDCQNETVTVGDILTDFRDKTHLIRFKNAATPSAFLNCGESKMKWASGTGGYSAFYVYDSTDIAGLCAAHCFVNNNGVALSDIIPATATSETDENATVYAIKNPQSNRYLTANTASTAQETSADAFVFISTDKTNVYKIYDLGTGHFLSTNTIVAGAKTVLSDGSGNNDLWFIRPNVTTGNTLSTDRIDIFPYGSFDASWNWHGGASDTNTMGLFSYGDGNSVWAFSAFTTEAAKSRLQTDLETANAIDETQIGEAVGYYDVTKLNAARSKAQNVLNNEASTVMQYFLSKYTLKNELTEALNMPVAGKAYTIVCAYDGFMSNQEAEKAIYSNGTTPLWNTLNEEDGAYYWYITPTGNGYTLQNVKDLQYAASGSALSGTSVTGSLNLLAPGQFHVVVGGQTFHTVGHNNGAGIFGTIGNVPGGGANSGSAWNIREANLSTVANTILSNAGSTSDTPQLGMRPTSAKNAFQTAITTFDNSGKDINDAHALMAAVETFKSSKVLPVFCIEGTINYATGKAIYDDGQDALHFTTAKKVNNQMLWIFDSENPATTISAGTYEVTNLNTGNHFWNSASLQIFNIEGTEGQFLMQKEGASDYVHAQENESVIVGWSTNTANSGSAWTFRYVGTTEELAQHADAFAAYQTLVSADKAAQEALTGYTFGTELNQFDPATRDAVTAATTDGYALVSDDTIDHLEQNKDALIAAATTIGEKVNAIDLNYPAAGTFLRIVGNPEGSTEENGYITGSSITISSKGRAVVVTDKEGENEAATILYYDNGKLLSYATGYYMANNNGMLGYAGITTGSPIEFAKSTGGNATAGFYNIHFCTANAFDRSLFCRKADNLYYTDGAGMPTPTNHNGYRFRLEAVNSLPVSVTAAGYASFYAPVALNIPEGVEAFIGHKNEDGWFTLEPLTDVIPANTGVILRAAEGTYNFDIAATAETVENNELTGTTASIATVQNAYTLQAQAEGTGLYPYTGEELKGFRAYAVFGEAQGIKGLAFRFGDVTAIDNAINLGAAKDAPVYDMSGRRVGKMQKGIYIVGGKKVIVK